MSLKNLVTYLTRCPSRVEKMLPGFFFVLIAKFKRNETNFRKVC